MTDLSSKDLSALVAAAMIGEVRLVAAEAKARIRSPEDLSDEAELTISHGGHIAKAPDKNGQFVVHASVEARVAASDPKEDPYFLVDVTFELIYRVPAAFKTTKGALEAFAETNGLFNAWPYCREFIQTTTARMGIPPLVLPLFRRHDRKGAKSAKALARSGPH